MEADHGDQVSIETFPHRVLGMLKIITYEDGWVEVFHRTGKLLNAHYSLSQAEEDDAWKEYEAFKKTGG